MKKIIITLALLLFTVGAAYLVTDYLAEQRLEQVLDQVATDNGFTNIQYETVDITLFKQEATLGNVSFEDLQGNEYLLREVLIREYDYQHPVPHYVDLSINGIKLLSDTSAMLGSYSSGNLALDQVILERLGEDEIPLQLDYKYQYDPENSDELVSNVGLGLAEYFYLELDATMRNVPLEALVSSNMQSYSAPQLLLNQAEIPNASLRLQDFGLVDELIRLQSEQSGAPEDSIRRQMVAQIQSLYLFAPPDIQQQAMSLGQEIATFIEGGKTFTLSLEPALDGKISSLQGQVMGAMFQGDYQAILALLNPQFKTE